MKTEFAHLARLIEIKNRNKIRQLRAGLFLTRQKGQGTDYKDARKYFPGDDPRLIDWNVTSRMNELYVREYHDEKELNVNIFLDVSASMNHYGLLPEPKFYYAMQFALLLSLVFSGTGDRLRLILYADQAHYISPVLKTKRAVFSELARIRDNPYGGGSDHLLPLKLLRERFPKRSTTYIISDFAGAGDMSRYRNLQKSHDLSAVRIGDGAGELPENLLQMFFLSNGEGGSNETPVLSLAEDKKHIGAFFKKRFLDLYPGKTGDGSIVQFFNE